MTILEHLKYDRVVVMIPSGPREVGIVSRHWFRWSAFRRARAYARHGFGASVWDWRWPYYPGPDDDPRHDNGYLGSINPPDGVRPAWTVDRDRWYGTPLPIADSKGGDE